MIKTKKGITLVSIIMTIIIVAILSTVMVYSIKYANNNVEPYNRMIADITLLEDKILIYYNKNGEIPITGEEVINGYYKIDLTKLENVTLNYGRGAGNEDYYLVNNNLKVYYQEGIEKSGEIYHTND